MTTTTPSTRQTSFLFVVVFFLAAAAISYWTLKRDPDYITLTINNQWRIYLIGESNIYAVQYHSNNFTPVKQDDRHLWLNGSGDITWGENTIRVHKAGIFLNDKGISKSPRETLADILFARDGTVRKGMLQPQPAN